MLQAKDVDIHKAVGVLQNTIQALSAYRDDFDQVKRTAQNLAERWGAQSEFTEIRKRRMKRHFDELSQDERLSNGESRFRINVFNASLDIINSQLSQRFTSMRETNELFQAIHPGTLNRAQDNALNQHVQRLADHYSRDLSPSFPVQLLAFRACFKTEMAKEPSVKDMTKMLIVDHSSMAATFSELLLHIHSGSSSLLLHIHSGGGGPTVATPRPVLGHSAGGGGGSTLLFLHDAQPEALRTPITSTRTGIVLVFAETHQVAAAEAHFSPGLLSPFALTVRHGRWPVFNKLF
ncbi:hypothetical protein KUCAC02_024681 [Chaenocephalus aceratus]|uniref:Uncharacterized protein n=1 Tax=Chaenocephalus aceratus TaxID=36190 RepID=A0ACB9WKD6_CHAAC|nr:hypothetical protein KUCAC02_024681 [Chaenocephalus aceratus]